MDVCPNPFVSHPSLPWQDLPLPLKSVVKDLRFKRRPKSESNRRRSVKALSVYCLNDHNSPLYYVRVVTCAYETFSSLKLYEGRHRGPMCRDT